MEAGIFPSDLTFWRLACQKKKNALSEVKATLYRFLKLKRAETGQHHFPNHKSPHHFLYMVIRDKFKGKFHSETNNEIFLMSFFSVSGANLLVLYVPYSCEKCVAVCTNVCTNVEAFLLLASLLNGEKNQHTHT